LAIGKFNHPWRESLRRYWAQCTKLRLLGWRAVEIDAMLGTKLEDTRVFREAKEEGAIGHAQSMILRQLNRKVGSISDATLTKIKSLSIEQLDNLGDALLDFGSIDDLTTWLDNQG
jgi:predicted transposase YdaD